MYSEHIKKKIQSVLLRIVVLYNAELEKVFLSGKLGKYYILHPLEM
jgi:hypothetical protein